jgi:hypothetical protein
MYRLTHGFTVALLDKNSKILLKAFTGRAGFKNIAAVAYLKQDTDAKVHEWFREVNNTLSSVVDRHRSHRQVRFLQGRETSRLHVLYVGEALILGYLTALFTCIIQ